MRKEDIFMKKLLSIILISLMFFGTVFSAENINANIGSPGSLQKSLILSDYWMDVNRMNGVFRNNGTWMYDNVAGDWGLEWPKGSGLSPVFAGGQYICAKVDGEIRVAGVQHSATEYQPGTINEDGTASNPLDGAFKWYVIKPGGVGDWANWPVDQGAPVDENGDPKLIGNCTAFSVWNDLADHTEYTTNKLGAEVRQTVFAFNRADALGDMIFIKWQIVNKSGAPWDSTYMGLWLDPDLGYAGDDYVGCDTTLGLGYCYNATNEDQNYGAAPPAMGMDFFQGPIIDSPGDMVTLPDGTEVQDKKMLSMTAFVYYNNDDSNQGNPDTGNDVWNYMIGRWRDGTYITNDGANGISQEYPPTKFMFSGDPVTNSGWLDSNADDRRFIMTTGPFDMGAWEDTDGDGLAEFGEPGVQEVVAVVICARGNSNLNSVAALKTNDELAQMAYDLDFKLASAPFPPEVSVSAMPNQVIMTWTDTPEYNADGSDYESADPIVAQAYGDTVIINNVVTEISDSTYNFYGYSVYQYSDAAGADPVLIGHWDNGGAADSEPYEFNRYINVIQNKNNVVGKVGDPLINGKEYYFGVVAEGYCEFGAPEVFESAATIISVIPQFSSGVRYHSQYNDTLEVTHTGESGGAANVFVVDPSKVTGKDYEISFNSDLSWNLVAGTDTVLSDIDNQTGNDASPIADGLMIQVSGPPPGIDATRPGPFGDYTGYNGWDYQGDRWCSWGIDLGGAAFGGSIIDGGGFFGTTLEAADFVDVEMRWAGDTKENSPDRWSRGYLYRRDMGYDSYGLGDVPFAAYDISDPDNPRRLNVCFVESDGMPSANDPDTPIPANGIWDMGWHELPGDTGYADLWGREYWFINLTDYDTTGIYDLNAGGVDGTVYDVLYAGWIGDRGPYLSGEWDMQIFASKVNSPADKYTFKGPGAAGSTAATQKEDLDKVKVVPNPYYGYHSGEMDPFKRWVQFTFLPAKCTVRIFDLAGNLIRKLEKDDDSTSLLQWDLKNEYELPIASGVYVYHVEAPGIGEKFGKLAIFTPNEHLDTY